MLIQQAAGEMFRLRSDKLAVHQRQRLRGGRSGHAPRAVDLHNRRIERIQEALRRGTAD